MTDDEKNKKKEDIFNLFGIDFEEIEHIFETMIERLKEKIDNREDIKDVLDKMEARNSFVRGFSMTFEPNGNPHFDMFGDHISHGGKISDKRE